MSCLRWGGQNCRQYPLCGCTKYITAKWFLLSYSHTIPNNTHVFVGFLNCDCTLHFYVWRPLNDTPKTHLSLVCRYPWWILTWMSLLLWLFADLYERIHFFQLSSHLKQDTTTGSSAERLQNLLNRGHEQVSVYPRMWVRKIVLWLSLLFSPVSEQIKLLFKAVNLTLITWDKFSLKGKKRTRTNPLKKESALWETSEHFFVVFILPRCLVTVPEWAASKEQLTNVCIDAQLSPVCTQKLYSELPYVTPFRGVIMRAWHQ